MRAATSFPLVLAAALPGFVLAEPIEQNGHSDHVDTEIVRVATEQLLEKHLRQGIDHRQLSAAWAQQFMLALDPRRMHFLVADDEEFLEQSASLVADARSCDLQFAVLVMERFRKRLEANTLWIDELLATKHDFTVDESVRTEHLDYAAGKAESDQRWRLRIKYELLLEKTNASDDKSSRDFLRGRYSRILQHVRSLNPKKTASLYVDALAKSFDSNSAYFDDDFLTIFRTSHFPNYSLGMKLEFRKGDLWILPTPRDAASIWKPLAGHRIVAVRRDGQEAIHITGLTDRSALRTLISPAGELGHAKTVVLEVDEPKRGLRMSVACDRWMPGR